MDLMCNFVPGDPRLVEQIVKELKSQGIFDQFRKECISDVDTKPAYQNLRQRVEGSVSSFLKEQTWSPEMNKNQVREMLRKHIHESGFLETGVERIVDQVVNPKINSVFLPKVEDVMYKYLGIERPKEKTLGPLEITTLHDLLPKDLEAISPEIAEENVFLKGEIDEVKMGDASSSSDANNEKMVQEENSIDSQFSVLSGVVSHDSNNSLKQDSLMSLNSSESRMSISENILKIESEDTNLSNKSSDSNSKTEQLTDEKIETESLNVNNKDEVISPIEENTEKNSEEAKSKPRDSTDKKKERHHSSSDRSKSRSEKEKDKSRSDRHNKKEDSRKDVKPEKYKIPKLSDKSKESKSKEKDDKHRSDKGRSDKDSKTDKDRKSEKDRRSKHSSRESDKSRKDKNEKKDKDEKRDKKDSKDSSKSEKSKDDKRSSSSSKKRESSSSKDSHRDKDSKNKDETSEKNKNGHSSSSSGKDSKSRKDEDKSKSSHKKDDKSDKEDRKRKRKSKDDHYSSKEKRNGGRSSDRDSDGPTSNKRFHVSPPNTTGDNSNQQTSQESSGPNSEGSSGYSGNSDKTEDKPKPEDTAVNALIEIQKIKLPKFASNYQEAMKIMKIRKLLKKLDSVNEPNPNDPEVQRLMKEIEELTKDFKNKDKKESKEKEDKIEIDDKTDENQKSSKSAPINIDEFISSSNISMAKWNALEAQLMEQITDVDYNSYESPYMDEEEHSFETKTTRADRETNKEVLPKVNITAPTNEESENVVMSPKVSKSEKEVLREYYKVTEEISNLNEKKISNETEDTLLLNIPIGDEFSKNTTEVIIDEQPEVQPDIIVEANVSVIPTKFKDFKQRAIVLLRKHTLTEEMIKMKNEDNNEQPKIDCITEMDNESLNVLEIGKENIEVNTIKKELDPPVENLELLGLSQHNNKPINTDKGKSITESNKDTTEETNDLQNLKKVLTNELDENNLVVEEHFSHNIDIYSLQNSCEVCLDSKGNMFKGFEPTEENLRSLNIIHYIINILENEISKSKENMQIFNKNKKNQYQTRKRKVNEKKSDTSNNNFDDPASKRLEVEDIPKNISPSKRIQPHTNSKTRVKSSDKTENSNVQEKLQDNQVSEMKSRRQSIKSESPDKTKLKSLNRTNPAVDGSSEKKNRTNQRYTSDDLYKPRMHLRRSGRDFKNS